MTIVPVREVLLATHNAKKGRELGELLAPLGLSVVTLADQPGAPEPEETGGSFAENARIKAIAQAKHFGQWALADDSGIEVEALAGAPGIYSARFAGPRATDADNNALLLERLAGLPADRRWARYYCHVTVADPAGRVWAEANGICRGRLLAYPNGHNGFGYDPLFEVVEYHRTFGELGPAVKRAISHRARAMRRLLPSLRALATGAAVATDVDARSGSPT